VQYLLVCHKLQGSKIQNNYVAGNTRQALPLLLYLARPALRGRMTKSAVRQGVPHSRSILA